MQAGLGKIFADDLRSRCKRGFHPRCSLQTLGNSVAGQQTGSDENRGVRRVGAGRDGGNRHIAMAEIEIGTFHRITVIELARLLVVAFHRTGETGGDILQRNTPFRTFRAGHRRHDVAEIEFQRIGEDKLGTVRVTPHALRLRIGFDKRDTLLGAAGHVEIVDGFRVDREETAGRAIFRAHIADRRTVGDRHVVHARSEELDEFRNHALLAQHLHDGEHEVGRGDALFQLTGQLEADDLRQKHGNRLAEHRGFRFDTAHTPAENAETIDHRGMAVGADAGIGIGGDFTVFFIGPDGLAKIFEIHLVADAGAGRYDAKILERLLAPFEEAVTLAVALVFQLHIAGKGGRRTELVDNDRVVDDQVDGHQRIDLFRIAAERLDAIAHGGKVDDRRNAGKVLHQNAGRAIGDLGLGQALVVQPFGNRKDLLPGDRLAVFETKQVFEQHLHREGQLGNTCQAVRFGLGQAVIDIVLTAYGKDGATLEAIDRFGHGK
ncbi:hypothetical protein D3C80_847130 [compost metagenome]